MGPYVGWYYGGADNVLLGFEVVIESECAVGPDEEHVAAGKPASPSVEDDVGVRE